MQAQVVEEVVDNITSQGCREGSRANEPIGKAAAKAHYKRKVKGKRSPPRRIEGWGACKRKVKAEQAANDEEDHGEREAVAGRIDTWIDGWMDGWMDG